MEKVQRKSIPRQRQESKGAGAGVSTSRKVEEGSDWSTHGLSRVYGTGASCNASAAGKEPKPPKCHLGGDVSDSLSTSAPGVVAEEEALVVLFRRRCDATVTGEKGFGYQAQLQPWLLEIASHALLTYARPIC